MDLSTLFIGSYTEYPIPGFGGIGHGIYSVQLNNRTGELKVLHTQKVRNPSYLAISDDNRFLYGVTELDERENPKVQAFRIKEDLSLAFLNEQAVTGGYPCHLIAHGKHILVACYATGNVLRFPLDLSGKLMPPSNDYGHKGSSVHSARQEAPHAHQVSLAPNGRDIYVCDLGIDKIKAYHLAENHFTPHPTNDCKISKGSGPRHMVYNNNGDFAYVVNELTGTVSVLQNKQGTFKEIKTCPTLPIAYKGIASASAIRIHPNGRFLYTANRNLEAITIFKVDGDKLDLIEHQYTKGDQLREINISPNGDWLIACHQNSHDTVVYRVRENGTLTEKYRTKEILSPVCAMFHKNVE